MNNNLFLIIPYKKEYIQNYKFIGDKFNTNIYKIHFLHT